MEKHPTAYIKESHSRHKAFLGCALESTVPLLPWSAAIPEYCHLAWFFEHLGFEVLFIFCLHGGSLIAYILSADTASEKRQLPERCLSRQTGIVRYCLRDIQGRSVPFCGNEGRMICFPHTPFQLAEVINSLLKKENIVSLATYLWYVSDRLDPIKFVIYDEMCNIEYDPKEDCE